MEQRGVGLGRKKETVNTTFTDHKVVDIKSIGKEIAQEKGSPVGVDEARETRAQAQRAEGSKGGESLPKRNHGSRITSSGQRKLITVREM